ncbi:MAG: endonuclease III [Aerococcus sp.]|nr:endonuclease III [Aerococcus sp.]
MMLTKQCTRHVIEEIIKLYPNVTSALNFNNPFELLIAVMLSAQTTDRAVNGLTPKLFATYPTPEAMAKATPEEVAPYIRTIGLYRNKSKYLVETAQKLVAEFNGEVPKTRKDLESLPGVGRKTANVVLSVGFGIPAFAVDTHVTRIAKHHHIAEPDWTPRQIEDRVMECLPKEEWLPAHQALIYFGREICHPRNPECHNYPQLYTCLEEE